MIHTLRYHLLRLGLMATLPLFGFQTKAQVWDPIPDPEFVAYLTEWWPELMDGNLLNTTEAATYAPSLNCSNRGIENIYGVQFFDSMQVVDASFNALPNIPDISRMVNLRELNLSNNQLQSLPSLSGNVLLEQILVSGNKLNSLPDVRFNTELTHLIAPNNEIQVVQSLYENSKIEEIQLQVNKLTRFPDLHPDAVLTILTLNDNELSELRDLSRYLGPTSTINLSGNQLSFQYLEPYASMIGAGFFGNQNPEMPSYAPVLVLEQQSLSLDLEFDTAAEFNVYDWYKDGEYFVQTNENRLDFGAVTLDHSGQYHCVISNSLPHLSGISFTSDTFDVEVIGCLSPSTILVDSNRATCDGLGSVGIEISVGSSIQLTSYRLSQEQGTVINSPIVDTIYNVVPGEYSLTVEGVHATLGETCQYHYPTPVVIEDNLDDCSEPEPKVEIDDSRELTPNGDGFNDAYPIEDTGTARIYDKNGRLVVELSIPGEWDGTDNSGLVKTTGLYLIEINGEPRETIYLIR